MAFVMGVMCLRTRLGKCWIGLQTLRQNNQLTHKHVITEMPGMERVWRGGNREAVGCHRQCTSL